MNGRKVSATLTALPEDMVAEAMEPGHRGRSFSWLRLAVCAVLVLGLFVGFWPSQPEIVTAPGLLTVTVYAEDRNSQTGVVSERLKQGVKPILEIAWCTGNNSYPGSPIMLSIDSDDFPSDRITFEICVSEGKYVDWGEHTKYHIVDLPAKFTVNNYSTIYWSVDFQDNFLGSAYDQVYSNVVIRCEDHIIGYSELRFDRILGRDGPSDMFEPLLVSSVIFPKINGEYQNVSYEYVYSKFTVKE